MISYDKTRRVTVDSETGDYLDVLKSHYSDPVSTWKLCDKQDKVLLVADLIGDGKVNETPEGQVLFKKWEVNKAWEPKKNTPYQTPTNFEVSQDLLDRLMLFLKKLEETRGTWAAPPEVEFIDRRAGMGDSK
jgi:hypothetical protein